MESSVCCQEQNIPRADEIAVWFRLQTWLERCFSLCSLSRIYLCLLAETHATLKTCCLTNPQVSRVYHNETNLKFPPSYYQNTWKFFTPSALCFFISLGCDSLLNLTSQKATDAVDDIFRSLRDIARARMHMKQFNSIHNPGSNTHQASAPFFSLCMLFL